MAGLSIDQIAKFLSVSSATARDIVSRYHCRTTKVKGGFLRISLEEFLDILFRSPRYMNTFKHNVETDSIFGPYKLSAKIVLKHVYEKEDEQMEQNNQFLTTRDVMDVAGGIVFRYSREVSDACRRGKLFGIKIAEGSKNPDTWGRWMIPIDALTIYIAMDPKIKHDFVTAFRASQYVGEETSLVYKIKKQIVNSLDTLSTVGNEKLSYKEVSDILSVPENQVATMFQTRQNFAMKLKFEQPYVPMKKLAYYLIENPTISQFVYERWARMMKEKDPLEPLLRHALMVREYYLRMNEQN